MRVGAPPAPQVCDDDPDCCFAGRAGPTPCTGFCTLGAATLRWFAMRQLLTSAVPLLACVAYVCVCAAMNKLILAQPVDRLRAVVEYAERQGTSGESRTFV